MNMIKCATFFELGWSTETGWFLVQYLMVKKALSGKSYRKSEITEGNFENS